MYHYVRRVRKSKYQNLKALEFNEFKRQIDFFLNNFNILNVEDFIQILKTKKINLKTQKDKDSASVVSISELNDMKDSLEKPKKSRRKPKSERNTVSLNFS